jgi:YidC/Oxa1 family membrane protein insertase
MDIRRIILAVILMAGVLIVTPMLFPTLPPATDSTVVTDSTARQVDSTTFTPDRTAAPVAGSDGVPLPRVATAGGIGEPTEAESPAPLPIDTALVETERALFRTTNQGAALVGVEMRQYVELRDRGRTRGGPVELAAPGDRLLSWRLVVPGDTIRFDRVLFNTTRSEENGRNTVRYDAIVANRPVSITYSFLPDSYRVNIAAQVGGEISNAFLLVDMPPGFRSSEADSSEDRSHLSYAYKPELKNAKGISFGSLDPGERRIEPGPLTWVVAKNKYFLVGLLTAPGQPGFAELNVVGGVRESKQASRAQSTVVIPVSSGGTVLEMYAGPQEFKRMVAMGREFETSNPYGGFMQGLVQPFATMVIRLLLWMKATLGLSYGWILVIFGIAVRIILWPINQRAMRASLQMQRIQPELQAIQAKYKGEPQKLQQEMMRVYKEHNMSPFSSVSGCLPMLIPLPVFFALFFVFQNTIEFRGVPFLWFPDISLKDPYYVIPVLVAITAMGLSWIGMRGIKANDQQKMMMYMMPIVMLIVFLNMAAGLNLYYLVQNLASLPQQWLIAQERKKVTPLVQAGPASAGARG